MTKGISTDKRLLEALDYIDRKYIAEVTDGYEVLHAPGEAGMPKSAKKRFYVKLAAYAAAAMLFLGLVSNLPVLLQNIANLIPSGNVDPISEEEYYDKYHDPEWEYYGKYGDCYASLPSGGIDIPSSETVGGLKFNYETTAQIKIFYGGRFYTLGQAYNKGILSAEDLQRVHLYHEEIKTQAEVYRLEINYNTMPISLYEYEVKSILYDYSNKVYEMFFYTEEDKLEGKWSIDCLYKKDGVYAVYVDEYGAVYSAYTWTETVNGLDFVNPYRRYLRIFCDGDSHMISEAFELGIIDEEMLLEIHKAFYEHYDDYVAAGSYFGYDRRNNNNE